MDPTEIALAVRPGEHACCRFAQARDRDRLALAFIRDGLRRGHKVVYLHDAGDVAAFRDGIAALDAGAAEAISAGQLELRAAREAYTPDGTFDADRMLASIQDDQAAALGEGYSGLSVIGEMGQSVTGAPGAERLHEYERRLDALDNGRHVLLCQYDHGQFAPGALATLAGSHDVDLAPELAAIGREGVLAAARVRSGESLRFAGELDYGSAPAVAEVLDAHYHGELRLDLADLSFVDVAGMRALRGRKGQRLSLEASSQTVRQLIALMGWDTDPDVMVLQPS
jgi:anti-anti-sigma factor